MNTSNPFCFAALKIRSIFSTVLFSLTLSPTNGHARPFFAQNFIPRIDEDDRGVALIDLHVTSALRIANISTLRRRSPPGWPPTPDVVSHSQTPPPRSPK